MAWEATCLAVIVVTAFATPYETAFAPRLKQPVVQNPWFWFNRMIEFVFLVDMILRMWFVPYRPSRKSLHFINNQVMIARHYARTSFCSNFVALLPYDLLTVEGWCKNDAVTVLRLFRLVRVARLSRVAELFASMCEECAAPYAFIEILKFLGVIVLAMHWMACLWGLAGELQRRHSRYCWLNALEDKPSSCAAKDAYEERRAFVADYFSGDGLFDTYVASFVRTRRQSVGNTDASSASCQSFSRAPDKYLASLYFAIFTVTGIGYGDINATTRVEYFVSSGCTMVTSILWAFIIGNFCAIVASMNKHPARFRLIMDELNTMLRQPEFDPELCARVREYFQHSRNLMRSREYGELDVMMSSELRGEVASVVSEQWLSQVWYFRDSSCEFMREVSMSLEPLMFAPFEIVEAGRALVIVQRGIVMFAGRIFARGDCIGTQFICARSKIMVDDENRVCASAFSYVEVLSLKLAKLEKLFPLFPAEARRIRRAVCWIVLKQALIRWACNQPHNISRRPGPGRANTRGRLALFTDSGRIAPRSRNLAQLRYENPTLTPTRPTLGRDFLSGRFHYNCGGTMAAAHDVHDAPMHDSGTFVGSVTNLTSSQTQILADGIFANVTPADLDCARRMSLDASGATIELAETVARLREDLKKNATRLDQLMGRRESSRADLGQPT